VHSGRVKPYGLGTNDGRSKPLPRREVTYAMKYGWEDWGCCPDLISAHRHSAAVAVHCALAHHYSCKPGMPAGDRTLCSSPPLQL